MFSKKLKNTFNRISQVISPGPKVYYEEKKPKKKTSSRINKMNLNKKYTITDLEQRLYKDKNLKQKSYMDIVNFSYLQANPEFLVRIDDKQRDVFLNNALNLQFVLQDRTNNLITELGKNEKLTPEQKKYYKNELKKNKYFHSKLTNSLANLEKEANPYRDFIDINSKPEPKYESNREKEYGKKPIPDYITNLLYNIEKMPVEFGGGYSPELFYEKRKIPEKLVLRKFKPTMSFHDVKEDLPIHTHPNRDKTLNFSYWGEDFKILDQEILNKINKSKDSKSIERLHELRYRIASPYDYLPSKQDIKVAKESGKSNLEVSSSGMFIMTSPVEKSDRNEKLSFEFDKDLKEILQYALIKSGLNKKFHSINQLEKRVNLYNKIVIDTYRKALAENKIRSEFYPSPDHQDMYENLKDPKFIVTESDSERNNNRYEDRRYDIKKLRNKGTKKRFR